MMDLDFSFLTPEVFQNFILKGLWFSIKLTLVAMIGGIFFGTLIALMRLSGKKWLSFPALVYTTVFRAVPMVMVILWFFLLIPLFTGRSLGAEYSAMITFVVFQTAYFSEIMRAGVQNIRQGQVHAALAAGMSYRQCMQYVVLPQAFRNMLPVLMSETIILFQNTSLVYAIGAYDLLKGFEIIAKNFNRPVESYLIAAVMYFSICIVLSMLVKVVHKKVQIIR